MTISESACCLVFLSPSRAHYSSVWMIIHSDCSVVATHGRVRGGCQDSWLVLWTRCWQLVLVAGVHVSLSAFCIDLRVVCMVV